jgi:hypothetical protein
LIFDDSDGLPTSAVLRRVFFKKKAITEAIALRSSESD